MASNVFDVKSCKYLQGGDGERGTGRSAHGGNRNRDCGKLIEPILNRDLLLKDEIVRPCNMFY